NVVPPFDARPGPNSRPQQTGAATRVLLRRCLWMRRATCLTKKEAHHNRSRTASNPKQSSLLKIRCQVWLDPNAFPDMICVNWAHERCNRENQEIDPASRARLDIIRVDFLDDAVRNHRGDRCDTKYEHCDLRWNRERHERDLDASEDHDRRAPHDYRFSPSDTVGDPTE